MSKPCDDNEHNFALPLMRITKFGPNVGRQPTSIETIPLVLCTKCGQALKTDGPVNDTLKLLQKESEAINA